ncbi:MAG TPA: EamA family transporter [Gemmatimonadaceae bacterium]|nr:EamA family transporter [Gemmatimonadaceae bacterium]
MNSLASSARLRAALSGAEIITELRARSNERASERARTILAFAAIYIIWGSTFLAIRYSIETVPPFVTAGTRYLTAGAAMYLWARRTGASSPSRAQWRTAAIVGAFLLLCGNGSVTWSEQRVPSGITSLLVATIPLWMVLVEWARSGRRPSGAVMAGVIAGFVGLAFLARPWEARGGVDRTGTAVLLAGSLAFSYGSLISRDMEHPPSPLLGAGMQMLAGGAMLMALAIVSGELAHFHVADVTARSAAALAYLIIPGALVAYTCYSYLVRRVRPALLSTYAYVNPVVAVFLGWLVASEPLSARTLIAAGVILASVVVIVTEQRR